MLSFFEGDLTYLIIGCKSNEKYFIDDFYYNILSEKEIRDKNIETYNLKSIDLHGLALLYAKKYASLTNNENLLSILKNDKFEEFIFEISKSDVLLNEFQTFIMQDRIFCYEFCKNNNLPLKISNDFVKNFIDKATSIDNLIMHLSSMSKLFSYDDVSMESDIFYIEDLENILNILFDKSLYREFLLFFNLICKGHFMYQEMLNEYLGYARIAEFNLRKDFLLKPSNINRRTYMLYFFGCDKCLLQMVLAEFKNFTVNLRFEATDNPYGYAFGITVNPNLKENQIDKFLEFLIKNKSFYKRFKERTDKPTMIKMIIRTEYFPQNNINEIDITADQLKVLYELGIDIEIENILGE